MCCSDSGDTVLNGAAIFGIVVAATVGAAALVGLPMYAWPRMYGRKYWRRQVDDVAPTVPMQEFEAQTQGLRSAV